MRVVKIKADNTYNYKLPPYVVESFWRHLLTSDENLKKLKDLYDNLPVPVKPTYTILDYINGMDYIVRKIETELNIQDREVHIGPESGKMTDFDKSDHRYRSESDSMFDSRINNNLDAKVKLDENTQTIEGVEHRNLNGTIEKPLDSITSPKTKEKEVKVKDMGYDSDDVFANNPSSLMMAKVKIFRPKRPRQTETSEDLKDRSMVNKSVGKDEIQNLKNVKFDNNNQTMSILLLYLFLV